MTHIRKKLAIVLLGFFFAMNYACQSKPTSGDQFCIKLIVSKRPLDFESPWLTLNETIETYYGTVVEKNLVLTSADAVKDHTLIEAQAFGSTAKEPVSLAWVDYEANLAAIQLPASFKKHKFVPIGLSDDLPRLPKLVKAKNVQETTEVFLTFLKAELRQSDISQLAFTHLMFEATQKNNGAAEPIIENGELVGIAVAQADNTVIAIPSMIIKHFLADDLSGKNYKGFTKLGVFGTSLSDPVKIQQLGLPEDTGGNLVTRVLEGSSAAGILQENDVITEIDGYDINKDGQVQDSTWGRLHFAAVLDRFYAGEKVGLTILRNKKEMDVDIPLKRFSSNDGMFHIVHSSGERDYRIIGGMVLQELSLGFLKTFGDRWMNNAPLNLLYMYGNNLKDGYTAKRRILMNKVFADAGNRGYEEAKYQIIKTLNGQPVSSIADIDKAISEPVVIDGKSFLTVELDDGSGDFILDHEKLGEIDARIRQNYNLP